MKNLFSPIVAEEKLNKNFKRILSWPGSEPHRMMMNEIFQLFSDIDGNFQEQFQTQFDSRVFELYLFAYFHYSGYEISRKYERPDFIIKKDGIEVAIEATTVNPTISSNDKKKLLKESYDKQEKENLIDKLQNELPIKFGGPLFSKLKKKYWELKQCEGKSFVIAIEAFHDIDSLVYSDSSLSQYLYGLRQFPSWTEKGKLIVNEEEVRHHIKGDKIIPSNFFGQESTRHVSAILFSNSGTYAKFGRMGYQAGYHRGNILMSRTGYCYDPNPDSAVPLNFHYDLDHPFIEERWGQGTVVLYNPNAIHPLPRGFFVDSVETYMDDGKLQSDVPMFHPFASITSIGLIVSKSLKSVDDSSKPIGTILKREFHTLFKKSEYSDLLSEEKEWFADENRNIIGTVFRDKIDDDFLFVILGRDERGEFRAFEVSHSFETREEARKQLIKKMTQIFKSGRMLFPQGD